VSDAIQLLLREPAVELSFDMGQGSREQTMAAAKADPRIRDRRAALPCPDEAAVT
jgi:hypothetical protein